MRSVFLKRLDGKGRVSYDESRIWREDPSAFIANQQATWAREGGHVIQVTETEFRTQRYAKEAA